MNEQLQPQGNEITIVDGTSVHSRTLAVPGRGLLETRIVVDWRTGLTVYGITGHDVSGSFTIWPDFGHQIDPATTDIRVIFGKPADPAGVFTPATMKWPGLRNRPVIDEVTLNASQVVSLAKLPAPGEETTTGRLGIFIGKYNGEDAQTTTAGPEVGNAAATVIAAILRHWHQDEHNALIRITAAWYAARSGPSLARAEEHLAGLRQDRDALTTEIGHVVEAVAAMRTLAQAHQPYLSDQTYLARLAPADSAPTWPHTIVLDAIPDPAAWIRPTHAAAVIELYCSTDCAAAGACVSPDDTFQPGVMVGELDSLYLGARAAHVIGEPLCGPCGKTIEPLASQAPPLSGR